MGKMTLEAKTRTVTGKKAARTLRAAGRLPAVVYNSEGKSTMIDVDEVESLTKYGAILLRQL